jgi:hypothetical protein
VNQRFRRILRQPWLAQFALAVMLLHALVPMGFMPALSSDGALTLELCSAFSPLKQAPQGEASQPAPGKPDNRSDHAEQGACPYGALAHAVLPVATAQWLAPVAVSTTAEFFDARGFVAAPRPHSRLPRGPPASG